LERAIQELSHTLGGHLHLGWLEPEITHDVVEDLDLSSRSRIGDDVTKPPLMGG